MKSVTYPDPASAFSGVVAARTPEPPTLSKIVNGRVSDLSLELLIRIAVRAELPVVMQTGSVPEETGAYICGKGATSGLAGSTSKLAQSARDALTDAARELTPEQRLNAMLEQTQLVSELHNAGRQRDLRLSSALSRTVEIAFTGATMRVVSREERLFSPRSGHSPGTGRVFS